MYKKWNRQIQLVPFVYCEEQMPSFCNCFNIQVQRQIYRTPLHRASPKVNQDPASRMQDDKSGRIQH